MQGLVKHSTIHAAQLFPSCGFCAILLERRYSVSQILEATFDGEVFRPTESVKLPPDTQVELVVTLKAISQEKPASFLRTARSLKLQGPKDWSSRIDDYLYGGATGDDA